MNTILLRYLQDEVSKRSRLTDATLTTKRGGTWIYCADESAVEPQTAERLESRPASKYRWKFSAPWQAVFWLSKSPEIALVLNVSAKKHDSTLDSLLEEFQDAYSAANKAYHANHDTLTGALTRHGFQGISERYVADSRRRSGASPSSDQPLTGRIQCVLFAFDIDNFKAVNDTYSHDAGDAVLVIFAERLIRVTRELEKEYRAKFVFGRPGGEEFNLLALGRLSKPILTRISETLLETIRKPSLPSSDELRALRRTHPNLLPKGKELPISVTASLGIARTRLTETSESWDEIYGELKDQADTALYRAKMDGRDCARFYEDIRLVHGRVFEFHSDSDLAIIDVGEKVGVRAGHTYRVFFPPFTGGSITSCDGRTTKTVGTYSLIESGRLLVLEAQRDISICVPQERINGSPFPKGALLHYVPRGSKPVLSIRPRRRQASVESLDGLAECIATLMQQNMLDAVIRVRGRYGDLNEPRFEEILAGVHLSFPATTRIFGLSGYGLYVVLRKVTPPISDKRAAIGAALVDLEKFIDGIRAGVFLPEVAPDGLVELTPESVLFCCSAAANAAIGSKERVEFFDHETPQRTIRYWRNLHRTEEALADYEQFRQYGFSSALLDNQLGLAIMESESSEYYPLGEASFAQASRLDASMEIYRANLGVAHAIAGKYSDAFQVLSSLTGYLYDRMEDNDYYVLALAKSGIECKRAGGTIADDVLKRAVVVASAVEPQADPFEEWCYEVRIFKAEHFPNEANLP